MIASILIVIIVVAIFESALIGSAPVKLSKEDENEIRKLLPRSSLNRLSYTLLSFFPHSASYVSKACPSITTRYYYSGINGKCARIWRWSKLSGEIDARFTELNKI